MSAGLPRDIFSRKRLWFNFIVYGCYTGIFLTCFSSAVWIISLKSTVSTPALPVLANAFFLMTVIKFFVFNFFNFKRFALYSDTRYDLFKNMIMVAISCTGLLVLQQWTTNLSAISQDLILIDSLITFLAISVFHVLFRSLYRQGDVIRNFLRGKEWNKGMVERTMVVGTDEEAQKVYKQVLRQSPQKKEIVCFLDDDPELIGKQYFGVRVCGPISNASHVVAAYHITQVIIATASVTPDAMARLIDDTSVEVTSSSQVSSNEPGPNIKAVVEMHVETLLDHASSYRVSEDFAHFYENKSVMVTGAAGHIGSEICRQIIRYNPQSLIALDHSESHLLELAHSLKSVFSPNRIIAVVADLTNGNRLLNVFEQFRPQIIIHAAAYGHDSLTSISEEEAITNNILGTKNVADLASLFKTDTFAFLSTIHAETPGTTIDSTKRVSEMYLQGLNTESETKFLSFRFNRTLDSPGGVIPAIEKQIKAGGPVTIPNRDILLADTISSTVVHSILHSLTRAQGTEIFVFHTGETIPLFDLAKALIQSNGYELGRHMDIMTTDDTNTEWEDADRLDGAYRVEPSGIPNVSVLKPKYQNWETVKSEIKQIIEFACKYEDLARCRQLMDKIISECSPVSKPMIPFTINKIANL